MKNNKSQDNNYNNCKFKPGMRLTSTSDFTIDDIIDYITNNPEVADKITSAARGTTDNNAGLTTTVCTGLPGGVVPAKRTNNVHSLGVHSKFYGMVLQNGELWCPYTSRRFLPAQYLGLMHKYGTNISRAVAMEYDTDDFFRLFVHELERLIYMKKKWPIAYAERSSFMPICSCIAICKEYLNALREFLTDTGSCMYNSHEKTYYKKLKYYGKVYLYTKREEHIKSRHDHGYSDITSVKPTSWLSEKLIEIDRAYARLDNASYEDILDIVRKDIPQINIGTYTDRDGDTRYFLPSKWKELFIKQGAYYTLKSLIMNKHVNLVYNEGRDVVTVKNTGDALSRLGGMDIYSTPAYVFHAMLKKSMAASGFKLDEFLKSITSK